MDFSLIGLSGRDKRIYEALVLRPQASVRGLAEETTINRGSVYESIKALQTVGLVTSITVGKRVVFRAKDPEVLHEIIAEKQHQLSLANTKADEYIRSFAGKASDPSLFHFASFYEGDEGLAAILRDVLKTCRSDKVHEYAVISSPSVSEYLYNNFRHFTRERIKQKLYVRVLRQTGISNADVEYAESREISSQPRDTRCYTLIYGQKVALITLDDLNRSSGIIIDNTNFASIQRELFDHAWHIQK
jgi:sugar-specific transcriptional regulator TrmB